MQRRRVRAEEPQEEQPGADLPFHTKYRPAGLAEMIGQEAVVTSLTKLLKESTRPHAFLFMGPAGTGKTTLARIIASNVGCEPSNIIEVDAASTSGVDAMRELTNGLRFQGFGDSPNKAIIIDECHALSKTAWDSLLKSVEEPPAHVFFFFCTTVSGKVPETIVTRCHSYTLKPARYDDVMDLLEMVAKKERLQTPEKVLQLVARACDGSMRRALVMLSQVRDCEDLDEAARIVETPLENKEVIDLCRLLVSGRLDWPTLTKTLKAMPEMPAESIRIVIVNYLASCLMGSKTEKEAVRLLDMLYPFNKPFPTSDKLAPLLQAFGDLLFRD